MTRALRWLTGAEKDEQLRVFLTFLALFCLLLSYYIVKPLRNSKFLSEFNASRLPFVYAGVAVLSFSLTKVFSHLAKSVEKYRLVIGAYCVIVLAKLIFAQWLPHGGKPAVVCFYFFASVYFLLAVATLWACINDMFTVEQGERLFGFIALGSTFGGIAGSRIGRMVANSPYRGDALYIAVCFLILALVLVLLAAKLPSKPVLRPARDEQASEGRASAGQGFWSELRALSQRPFLRNIALSVMLLAVATTAVEFVSQAVIDRDLAQVQFREHFGNVPGAQFEDVYRLKTLGVGERKEALAVLAEVSQLSLVDIRDRYKTYKADLERETTSFFAQTAEFQGYAGIFMLLVVARLIFPNFGMRFCFSLLPCVAIAALLLFRLGIDLLVVQSVLVAIGALNYNLNNAAKEILYTATDQETLFRFKPMIEGPCMRTGDVLASVFKLSVQALAAVLLLSALSEIHLFLLVASSVCLFWLRCAWLAGKWFDDHRAIALDVVAPESSAP